jgi:hypothetical protein
MWNSVVGGNWSSTWMGLLWGALMIAAPAGAATVETTLPVSFVNLAGLTFSGNMLYAVDDLSEGIHELDPHTGQSVSNWTIPGFAEHLAGLAWDGNNFWYAAGHQIGRLSLGADSVATVTLSYRLSGTATDLVYANGSLNYPEYLGPIRELNPSTGQITGSVNLPSQTIYGLTFDGNNFLAGYGPGGGTGTVWSISPQNGAVLATWETGAPNIFALAYDQSSSTLYIGTANSGILVEQVPEPGSAALGVLGLAAALVQRRRNGLLSPG